MHVPKTTQKNFITEGYTLLHKYKCPININKNLNLPKYARTRTVFLGSYKTNFCAEWKYNMGARRNQMLYYYGGVKHVSVNCDNSKKK